MSTPQKPWENQFTLSGYTNQGGNFNSSRMYSGRNGLQSHAPSLPTHPTTTRATGLPPLPPRPPQLASAGLAPSYGMGSTMYGGYNGYPNYGGYSSFGSYPGSMYMPGGYNYGSYGNFGNGFENRFLQVAEEGSRNAFQSIESLVRAFTSVSMMLESTYHAMYSSFRAILGVVDNFSRLRLMFAQFLSAITILRIIKNFYRRLLYWLGVLDNNPQPEHVWGTVTNGDPNNQVAKYSAWPLITFFGLLFGGPYLISKLFTQKPKDWDPAVGSPVRAPYPYEAASEAELSFQPQEVLNLAPVELQLQDGRTGWLLARNSQGKIGYVPVTRIYPLPPRTEARSTTRNIVTNPINSQDVNNST
uniref:Peroxisomal membrane protein PEX13 n=1 Tax=Graphocephala atropunctata TaxID=36148 RepID=A0A1B6KTP6_9HEMI